MKRAIIPLLAFAILCACKKDKSAPEQPTIVGEWTPVTAINIDVRYKNGVVTDADTIITTGRPGEYVKFEKDGVYTIGGFVHTIMPDGSVIYEDDFETDSGTYTVSGTTLTMNDGIDEEAHAIDRLTSTELQVSYSEEVALSADEKLVSKSTNQFKR